MTRVRKKDGMVFVTQLSDMERHQVQELRRNSATTEEWREKMAEFLTRRKFEIGEDDKEIFAWS